MSTHRAAILPAKGQQFEVKHRTTPKPGPGELLIAVKAVALNPADHLIRDLGLFVQEYPTVLGFDIAGLVIEVGEDVPTEHTSNNNDVMFKPGVTRVAAYAAFAWNSCQPDYGAFQERCTVPWQHAALLPDGISWAHAATLPVAVQVPLMAWDAMDIPRFGSSKSANCASEKRSVETQEALLVWGASSSVGTMGVQTAQCLKESASSSFAAVYGTASTSNHDYIQSLGADRVFDYQDMDVVEKIISSAKEDGVVIRHCFLAMGDITLCQKVLHHFVSSDAGVKTVIASAPPLPADVKVIAGVETIFIQPSFVEEERLLQFQYWMGTWLSENLRHGTIKPSPEPQVVGKDLSAINTGLASLKEGVSCTKLVVELKDEKQRKM